jgi:hypothetical protein
MYIHDMCIFDGDRRAEDYEEVEQLYQGKASVLHAAKCRVSNIPVALKKYRKERLSNLNWHQARLTEFVLAWHDVTVMSEGHGCLQLWKAGSHWQIYPDDVLCVR